MSSLKPYQSAFNALRSILNYLPEHLPSSRHLAGGPPETFIPVPFWVPDIIVAGILVVVAACVGFGIWKTKKKHEEAKKRRLNVVQKPQELDVYDVPGPFAENVKIILQMFVGVGLAGIIILKILDFLGLGFDIAFLRDFVYHRPTLLIVGVALAYSSAIELAYTLFTRGPDEAVEPLIMGLAAAILLVISGISSIDLISAGGVALLVAALASLFLARYFFILERGWKHILQGKDIDNEGSHLMNTQPDEVKMESRTEAPSRPPHIPQTDDGSALRGRWSMALAISVIVVSMLGMKVLYQRWRISTQQTNGVKWRKQREKGG